MVRIILLATLKLSIIMKHEAPHIDFVPSIRLKPIVALLLTSAQVSGIASHKNPNVFPEMQVQPQDPKAAEQIHSEPHGRRSPCNRGKIDASRPKFINALVPEQKTHIPQRATAHSLVTAL